MRILICVKSYTFSAWQCQMNYFIVLCRNDSLTRKLPQFHVMNVKDLRCYTVVSLQIITISYIIPSDIHPYSVFKHKHKTASSNTCRGIA